MRYLWLRRLGAGCLLAVVAVGSGCSSDSAESAEPEPEPVTVEVANEGSASVRDSPTPDFGPLAVIDLPAEPDSDALLGVGVLSITDECVVLTTEGGPKLLVWQKDVVSWSGDAIDFRGAGQQATLVDGDRVVVGGTALTGSESMFVHAPATTCEGELSLVSSVDVASE